MTRPRPGPRAAAAALAAAMLAAVCVSASAEEEGALPRLIHGPRHAVSWDPSTQGSARLVLPADLPGGPATLLLRPALPAGIDYRLVQGGQGVRLPVQLDDCSELFGCNVDYEIGRQQLRIDAASHDFDGDGRSELVFALGHPELGVVVNVVKYVAPRKSRQPGRWRLVGRMEGPGGRVEVDGDSLTLPYGSLGLLDHWRLVKGRFVRVNS